MPDLNSSARCFISYRRSDSADVTGRIYDRLISQYGRESIFKDVDTIPLGSDFRRVIEEALDNCQVMLAVIGTQWLQILDEAGQRRIDSPSDYVRIEIETALSRDIAVIPLLVGGASIPAESDLPEGIRPLAYRHGILIRPDPDFHTDIDRLIKNLSRILTEKQIKGNEGDRNGLQLPMEFNSYSVSMSKFFRELLDADDSLIKASDLIKWCLHQIMSDQYTEGDAAGAWSKRYPEYLRFVYGEQGAPGDVGYHESVSLSRNIATSLQRYRQVLSNASFAGFVALRFALLRDYLIRHYDSKSGGFGLSTRRKLRGPATIDVDLRHTIQSVTILWELGNLDVQLEEMLRHTGAFIKKEMDTLELHKERVLTFSVVHKFLVSDASAILIMSDTARRALLKRLESTIVERFDTFAHSWDLDLDPRDTARIENAIFLLSDMPLKSCVDQDCMNVIQTAIKDLLANDVIQIDEQSMALPFYGNGAPDIGITLQLVKIILENRNIFSEYANLVKPMLNFCLAPENRTRSHQFAYPWHLASILEIAITS